MATSTPEKQAAEPMLHVIEWHQLFLQKLWWYCSNNNHRVLGRLSVLQLPSFWLLHRCWNWWVYIFWLCYCWLSRTEYNLRVPIFYEGHFFDRSHSILLKSLHAVRWLDPPKDKRKEMKGCSLYTIISCTVNAAVWAILLYAPEKSYLLMRI